MKGRSSIVLLVLVSGCGLATLCRCARQGPDPLPASEPLSCREHCECPSGVCSHTKADHGECAPERCTFGARTDNNHFFCNREGRWEKSRAEGEPCERDFMCFEPTCFMNPNCELGSRPSAKCREGKCVLVPVEDACSARGWVRVLAPEEFVTGPDQGCMQSLAQRVLRTVCVPCGNGTCDQQESACNCPADCARK